MSGIYLYAVVPPETPPPEVAGLAGTEVRAWSFGDFALWCSDLDARPAPSVESVRRHHAVVQAAFRAGDTPLPLRFGQWLPDSAAVEAHATKRRESFTRSLASVAGAAEFGLRVAREAEEPREDPPKQRETTGTAYLQALARRAANRRSREETGLEVLERIRAATAPIVRAERVEKALGPRDVVSVSHLVARADAAAYKERVRDVREAEGDLRFLVTGPWPPYSFSQ